MSTILLVEVAAKKIEEYAQNYLTVLNSISEDELWSTAGDIPNSIGTLARHLTGNLNHYFGAAMLQSGYVRTRDREFTERNVPKAKVIADLEAAAKTTRQALDSVDEQALAKAYTSPDGQAYESLSYYILHMAMHFAMHYGQADYAQYCVRSAKTPERR
jgi:Protein of unknown function (DUF664)